MSDIEVLLDINIHLHTVNGHTFSFPDCLMYCALMEHLCCHWTQTCFIANLYISLSPCLCSVSLVTLPTLSSVVSYSAHVLILLQRPHMFQTLAKLWLCSRSPQTHAHPIFTFEAKHHEILSKYHSPIDWIPWWNRLYCPRQTTGAIRQFNWRTQSKHSVAESHLHHHLHSAHYAQQHQLMSSWVSDMGDLVSQRHSTY